MDPLNQQNVQDEEILRQWKFYQGMDGIPFRTHEETVPHYKTDDPLSKKPKLTTDMHVDVFDLADKDQRLAMQKILDTCAKGKGYVSQLEREFDKITGGWKVLLMWGEFFLEDPREEAGSINDKQIF